MNAFLRSQNVLFLLKGANLGAATVWNFALIFVLIRRMPIADYTSVIIVTALGAYAMACDLGMSSTVYSRIRAAWLKHSTATKNATLFASAVLIGYLVFALVAAAIFATICFALPIGTGQQSGALSLYFLTLALVLPWSVVRALMGASDRYLRFETVELMRRLINLLLVLGLYMGLTFFTYVSLMLLTWLVAYLMQASVLRQLMQCAGLGTFTGWKKAFEGNLGLVESSGKFSALEFIVFNFPYVVLPLIFAGPHVIVAFDVFNKITRFGAQSNVVAFEAMLPATTRKLYSETPTHWMRVVGSALGISSTVACIGTVFVWPLGDFTFGLLLKDSSLVPQWLRYCMVAVLFSDVFRAAGALILLNIGSTHPLLKYSYACVIALSALVAITVGLTADFQTFMSGYILIFVVSSVLYFYGMTRYLIPANRT